MQLHDDPDLITELREAMASRADRIEIPDALKTIARRGARRRTAVRTAAIGAPVLAVAGVTTALLTATGSPGQVTVSAPGARHAGAAQDTAYVVRRVRAQLATTPHRVFETTTRGPGVASSVWLYADPRTGVQYQRDVTSATGSAASVDFLVATPVDHVLHFRATLLEPATRTYSVGDSVAAGPESSAPSRSASPSVGVSFNSSAAQIRRALSTGRVTRDGTTTIDGRPAVRLTVTPRGDTGAMTLYVDASSDAVLRSVTSDVATGVTRTVNWLVPSASNIARTQAQIPTGYTQVPLQTTAAK